MGYTAEFLNKYLDAQDFENDFGENYEPVVERDVIENADSLEHLLDLYRQEGEEFENLDDLWEQICDDWYWQNRERNIEQKEKVPADSIEIRYKENDKEYQKQLHIHGINHGGKKIIPLNPRVREHIAEHLSEITSSEAPLLAEENLCDAILQDEFDQEYMEEIDDHRIMNEEVDLINFFSIFSDEDEKDEDLEIDHGSLPVRIGRDLIKARARYELRNTGFDEISEGSEDDSLYSSILSKLNERLLENRDVVIASIDDKNRIAEVQNLAHSVSVPYNLTDDYQKQKLAEAREKSEKAKASLKAQIKSMDFDFMDMAEDSFNAFLLPEAVRTFNQYKSAETKHRSHYMAETSLEKLSEDVDEVHTLVGAMHQPQMIHRIEELDDEKLSDLIGAEPDESVTVSFD